MPDIAPNDLWAIHDLLLVGYSAVFMQKDSAGAEEARQGALSLAKMLPQLHPHGPCREALAAALGDGKVGYDELVRAAKISWSCLPAGFSETSFKFETPFTEAAVNDPGLEYQGRMPKVVDAKLGACEGSKWDRTCSYWTSMHLMAYRADALGLTGLFVKALVPLLAGGATQCGGCTRHFRLLHQPLLSDAFRQGISTQMY